MTHELNNNDASLWTILLTLIGLDGYFSYCLHTFYLIGEWFLGAIIMIYCIYPLTLYMFKKNAWLFLFSLLALSWWVSICNLFAIAEERNLICCLAGFVLGMFVCKYIDFFFNDGVGFVALLLAVTLCIYPILSFMPNVIVTIIMATSWFLAIRLVGGHFVQENKLYIIPHIFSPTHGNNYSL